MSRPYLWNVTRLILILCLCVIGQDTFAAQVMYVNNTQVNLRSGPTAAKNNVITTVPRDTRVEILSQQGSWYQVRLPDARTGWISQRLLVSKETIPITPVSDVRGSSQPEETTTEIEIPTEILGIDIETEIDLEADIEADIGTRAVVMPFTDDMVFIPFGTGIIGSDEREIEFVIQENNVPQDMLLDELPKETVPIKGFYIDRYEVTNAQYKQFVDATRYPPPLNWDNGAYPPGKEKHPVTFISWDDAIAYSRWAGKRLPRAEEWEVAARGMRGQIFPWGDRWAVQQINIDRQAKGPAPVGSYPDDVSPYEVYDMGGNVMEWTMTEYEENKDFFVLKGGSWIGKPFEARGANKTPGEAIYQLSQIGFRCAKSVNE